MASRETRCGFAAVIGAPNAGKSTLINRWVGAKVSIVSDKVQTTRSLVRGIAMHENSQVIFIDTPGIFTPRKDKRLENAMVAAAWQGQAEADVTVLVVDAARKTINEETAQILDALATQPPRPCLLVLNKTDKADKTALLALTQDLNTRHDFAATFMVSGLKGSGADDVLAWLATHMPTGPFLYDEDEISDMPQRLLAAEITREQLFQRLYQELPYGLTVETQTWENGDDGSITIHQAVYVARDSHKGIVLGKGGGMLKRIGTIARTELETIFDTRVHLFLHVKHRENWQDDPETYALWGLDYRA